MSKIRTLGDMQNQGQQIQQPQITEEMVNSAENVECPDCGSFYIIQAFNYKLINKFVVGAPQDTVVPIPVSRCMDCLTVIDMETAIKDAADRASAKKNQE